MPNICIDEQFVAESTTVGRHKALCMNELCNWRGWTGDARYVNGLHIAAEKHVEATGHTVEIVESERTTVRGRKAVL